MCVACKKLREEISKLKKIVNVLYEDECEWEKWIEKATGESTPKAAYEAIMELKQ